MNRMSSRHTEEWPGREYLLEQKVVVMAKVSTTWIWTSKVMLTLRQRPKSVSQI